MYVPLEFTLREWHMFAEIALDCTSKNEDMLVSDINAPLMIKEKIKEWRCSLSSVKFLEYGGGGGHFISEFISNTLSKSYPYHSNI